MIQQCATAAAVAMLFLAACSAGTPDQPAGTQAPGAEYREQLLADSRAALAQIPPDEPKGIDARVHLAKAFASLGDRQAAADLLAGAVPDIEHWPEGYGAAFKIVALARVSAEQAALGTPGTSVRPAAVQSRLDSIEDPESRAVAEIDAARSYAAAGIKDAALTTLQAASSAIGSVPSLARRSSLYRDALVVYERLGARARMREALAAIESSAWLEEDASMQPVALMQLAEVYAHLRMDDETEAIEAALPPNYHPAIEAAKAVALAADGRIDQAVTAAMAIEYAQARADALIGILGQPGARANADSLVTSAFEALAGSDDETARTVRYYALASALLPEDREDAAKSLQLALDLIRQTGSFWNFDEFADADIALAEAGSLDRARKLAEQIDDADRHRRQTEALTAVAAREAAKRGDWQDAHDLAMSLQDAAARTSALAGVLEELE